MRVDPHHKELVKAVVQLGLSLGKRVVAEGIETAEDLREVAAMGCECAQGWHIGRPMSAEATDAGLPSIAPLARKAAPVRAPNGLEPWHVLELPSRQRALSSTGLTSTSVL